MDSGKTTTVKKILIEARKPFLVIESAKKEYRNLATDTEVYTFGKPEINAPQINPFYILPGVSPQVHIDYLKDLFDILLCLSLTIYVHFWTTKYPGAEHLSVKKIALRLNYLFHYAINSLYVVYIR